MSTLKKRKVLESSEELLTAEERVFHQKQTHLLQPPGSTPRPTSARSRYVFSL